MQDSSKNKDKNQANSNCNPQKQNLKKIKMQNLAKKLKDNISRRKNSEDS